jgi:hypothetical protein
MNTVIYYPYITPRPDWLKVAALCWDKVYRLVPSNGWPDDSEATQELDQALGSLLRTVHIDEYADSIQDKFWTYIDAREKKLKEEVQWSPAASKERNAIFGMYESKFPGGEFVQELQDRNLARDETRILGEYQMAYWDADFGEEELEPEELLPRPGSAHEEYERLLEQARRKQDEAGDLRLKIKGSERTEASARAEALDRQAEVLTNKAEEIRKQNLVTYSYRDEENPVISLPKDVALHYLSLCASQAARDKRRDLVADGMKYTDAVFYDYSVRGEVGTAVLEAYLPENFSDLEPERIRGFRKEFSTQRRDYQAEVQSHVDKLANGSSEGELDSIKDDIVELAKQKVDNVQRTYRRTNQRMVLRTLEMSLTPPAIAAFVGSALGIGIFAPAGIAAAMSLFGAKLLIDYNEAKDKRAENPWSYVLDAAKL